MNDLEALTESALKAINGAMSLTALDDLRVEFLGKKGKITSLLKGLGKLASDERPKAGAKINEAKEKLQSLINTHLQDFAFAY